MCILLYYKSKIYYYWQINVNYLIKKFFFFTDQGNLSFDIDVDLSPEFHWNMNQLFFYAVVTYETESNKYLFNTLNFL